MSSRERARRLIDGWDTYGLELEFVENADGTCVHVMDGSGVPLWARKDEPRRQLSAEEILDLTLGVVRTVCGVRVRCNRGGHDVGGRRVGRFPDELLCARCHAAFGDRAYLIFECNRKKKEEEDMDDLEYTDPVVLTRGVQEGWADPETDPTRINWAERQARAAIPFKVVDGRPVNPCEETNVRYGRNELGHWGEALAADALVSVTDQEGRRWIVLVDRDDDHGWALPGGHVEPGETALEAAVRELREEAGLDLSGFGWSAGEPRYVPDPRASREAWMVTVLCRLDLGQLGWDAIPAVFGGDDARTAAWVRGGSFEELRADLERTYLGKVFPAHVEMLREALDGAPSGG